MSSPEAEGLGAEAEKPEVGAEKPAVAKMSQAEYGASVRQGVRRWRTGTSGPWRRRHRDPEEVGQGAESEEPSEEETGGCIEDQMKILRSKNENQREEKLCQVQNAVGKLAGCYQEWVGAKLGHDGGGAVNGFTGPNGGRGRVRALRATPGGRVRIVVSKQGLRSESRGPLQLG